MSETSTYTVTGMTCEHCVASVTEEITELAGVEAVDVDPRLRSGHRHQQPAPRPRRRAGSRRGSRLRPGMSTPLRVAAFVLALAVAFVGAVGVGRAVGPLDTQPAAAHDDSHDDGRPSGCRRGGRRRWADLARRRFHPRPRGPHTARGAHAARLHDPHVERPTPARLHTRAREGPAPHRRTPRPDRLPARAPPPRPGDRHVVDRRRPHARHVARDRRLHPGRLGGDHARRRRLRGGRLPSRGPAGRRPHCDRRHLRRHLHGPPRGRHRPGCRHRAHHPDRAGRRARHRPRALPRRIRPPRGHPGGRPGLPPRPPGGGRARSGGRLRDRLPHPGDLPALPRLPAPRRRPHCCLHRRVGGARGHAVEEGDGHGH